MWTPGDQLFAYEEICLAERVLRITYTICVSGGTLIPSGVGVAARE